MTAPNDKPREFWIIDETPFSTWVSSKPLHSADVKEEIHVIEKSAFDAVVEQLNHYRQFHDDGKCQEMIDKLVAERDAALFSEEHLSDRIDELEAENAKLKEEVERLKNPYAQSVRVEVACPPKEWKLEMENTKLRAEVERLKDDDWLADKVFKLEAENARLRELVAKADEIINHYTIGEPFMEWGNAKVDAGVE
jgi:cell division protein FtsB